MRRLGSVLLLVAVLAACTADAGEVVVHEWDEYLDRGGDPWIGLMWEIGEDAEILFLGEPIGPLGLEPYAPMGLYVHDELQLSDIRGLQLVTDSGPDGGSPSIEMVWSSGLGSVEGTGELDGALEREATRGLSFHLNCQVTQTSEHAVALVDSRMRPVKAWRVVDLTRFVSVLPMHIDCQ